MTRNPYDGPFGRHDVQAEGRSTWDETVWDDDDPMRWPTPAPTEQDAFVAIWRPGGPWPRYMCSPFVAGLRLQGKVVP